MADGQDELGIEVTADAAEDQAERDRVREEYRKRLAEKLKDPEFRKIEGFPIGTDEAILALSDPPYYTACPNPFIEEWLKENAKPYDPETDDYHREPFAADVSEGKNDPIYNAHSYHTKVPHKAIMRYIIHYTEPGDVVYDGFCGTGMTGVAAQLCGDMEQVHSLGYVANGDGSVLAADGNVVGSFGTRKAIISDLSPTAAFIAYNYNTALDVREFQKAAEWFFREIDRELGWMYQTTHKDGKKYCINYVVWSEVFNCPNCAGEVVFLEQALDRKTGQVADEFNCPHCRARLTKRLMSRAFEAFHDSLNNATCKRVKRKPVIVNYTVGKEKFEKAPDGADLELLSTVEATPVSSSFPAKELPFMHVTHVKDKMSNFGITHFSHFFLPRQQQALSRMWEIANQWQDSRGRTALLFMVEQCIWTMTLLNRFRPTGFSQVNQYMSGVFFVPSQASEISPWYVLGGKFRRLTKVFPLLPQGSQCRVSVNSGSDTPTFNSCVDYIFTDPPFGENLQYSELNWFNESFYRVLPNIASEAVVNKAQGKETFEYLELMVECLRENYRILKPGRWMTVVFHNSRNSIWNAIQAAIVRAGFVIADVGILDKEGETYKQSIQGVVQKDLVISCYKPRDQFEQRFRELSGQPQGVVEFLRQHLFMLPVAPVNPDGKLETVNERTNYMLFDRMVGYHLQRGARIPVSAAEFYVMLDLEFVERDGMYFLPDQAAKYDAVRVRTDVEPLSLFVKDERTAVQWVRARLHELPQTLSDLTPKLMQQLQALESYENLPELRDILKENFIQDEDSKWRVPDPERERDIEALRRKNLLKVFEGYAKERGQLKSFRKEAVIEGFKHCWQTKQYGVIVLVCEKIPAKILQEVPEFVQFYEIAKDLAPEQLGQLDFTWEA